MRAYLLILISFLFTTLTATCEEVGGDCKSEALLQERLEYEKSLHPAQQQEFDAAYQRQLTEEIAFLKAYQRSLEASILAEQDLIGVLVWDLTRLPAQTSAGELTDKQVVILGMIAEVNQRYTTLDFVTMKLDRLQHGLVFTEAVLKNEELRKRNE